MEIINLRGVLEDILCKVSSYYKAYITRYKRGVKQLLLLLQKSLSGTMVVSLLYYRKFAKILSIIGFEINPYGMCVFNKSINGSHMTICFHLDNYKLSHHKREASDFIIEWLFQDHESIFEDVSGKMSVIGVKFHEYLGMTLY